VAVLVLARDIPVRPVRGDPGPRAFPYAAAAVVLVGAVAAGLVDLRRADAHAEPSGSPRTAVVVAAATVAYLIGLAVIGFVAATTLFLLGVSRTLDADRRYPLVVHAAVAVMTAAVSWVAFGRLLEVVLPAGPWGF
jgi:hypothetical protein